MDCYIHNFLVTGKPTSIHSNVEKRSYYRLENIINLPTSLCILQLLENGRFVHMIGNWLNFDEKLKLFAVEQVGSVSAEEMQRMFSFGLLEETYEDAMRKVDTTQKSFKE